jgi:carboxypeptidase PM20D1
VTIAKAGTVDNVLRRFATAVVNFRVLPGDTTTTVMDYAQRVVADPSISVEPLKREEPSVVSATDSPGFKTITQTIRQLYPEAVIAPGLVPARTDSSHFAEITAAIFRFRPLRMTPGDVDRIHGTNERISVDGYAEMIRFYVQLLRNANSGE